MGKDLLVFAALLALAQLAACGGAGDGNDDGDGAADAGVDADGDADGDRDLEGESEADVDVGDLFIQAQVAIEGGDTFQFREPCTTTSVDFAGETSWSAEARDVARPFGFVLSWRESFVTGPGSFGPNEGVGDLDLFLVRAHPTEPGNVRASGVSEGQVVFEQVGYEPGDAIEGTFDGIVLDRNEPDDVVHIEADSGIFRCRVP